jgi:hypothetical protein
VIAAAFVCAPAQAATIKFTYDSSVTSLSNAAQIESDLNTVAQYFDTTFSSPATVNIGVSWGVVHAQPIPAGDISSSMANLYGYYAYGQVRSDLVAAATANPADTALVAAAAHLPATAPSGVGQYAIPYAEAKALGLVAGFLPGTDGWIGFSKSVAWDFAPAGGISAGAYDFEAAAAHEIEEVLGRVSGLSSTSPTFRTPLDLLRYGAPGQLGFAYASPAYFSVDGGATNLGALNYQGGGDRGDWLSTTSADAQSAYLRTGQAFGLTTADLTVLDALGWGGSNVGDTKMLSPTLMAQSFLGAGVPEPASWVLMLAGIGLVGAALRRRPSPAVA